MRVTAIDALRRSALLAASLPGVRVRLGHDGRVLAAVDGTIGRRLAGGVLHLGAGPFRRAVIDAARHQAAGGRVAMLGLPEDVEPEIQLGVAGCGAVRGGNVVVLQHSGACMYAFATTLDRGAASVAVAAAGCRGPRVDLHHDEELAATLVWTETQPDPCPTRDLATMQVVHDALAACAAAELDLELPDARYIGAV